MDTDHFMVNMQKKRAMPHMLVLEHVSPATRLLEKRRQMFEVQEALEQQKHMFSKKEEIFKRQEESLKKKDLDLQESLIKFSKFLQENDSKISRAEKKTREEIALRQQKEAEVQQLQATLDALKAECEQVLEVVEKDIKYQRYLESVLEVVDDHQEIGELLNRHETLVSTNADLKQQQQRNSAATEQTRSDMNAYVKNKTNEILDMNNQIARLKKELEGLRMEASDQEAVKDAALQVTSHNTLEYGQVVMSTENLFHRVTHNSKISHANEGNPLLQLESIGNFVSDLGHILRHKNSQASKSAASVDGL